MNAGDPGSRRTRSINSSISWAVGRRSGSTIRGKGTPKRPPTANPHGRSNPGPRMGRRVDFAAMGSGFGVLFRITTWGESHGPGIGVVVDGCPPRLPIDVGQIQGELDRRRPGQSRLVSQRK